MSYKDQQDLRSFIFGCLPSHYAGHTAVTETLFWSWLENNKPTFNKALRKCDFENATYHEQLFWNSFNVSVIFPQPIPVTSGKWFRKKLWLLWMVAPWPGRGKRKGSWTESRLDDGSWWFLRTTQLTSHGVWLEEPMFGETNVFGSCHRMWTPHFALTFGTCLFHKLSKRVWHIIVTSRRDLTGIMLN